MNDKGGYKMAEKIRIGIAGVRGLVYMPGFWDMDDVEVTAFCELNKSLLQDKADEFNIKHRFRVYEDMCDCDDVDAIVIATPMQQHVAQTLTALDANKHVLSEVTASTNIEELFWLKEAVEQSDKIYMMCENYCYRPDVILVKRLVQDGYLGEIYYAEAEYIEDIKSWLTYPNGKKSWRQYWQVGRRGAFYPTHSIGPIMQWFKDERIEEVSCFGVGPYTDPKFRQEDTTTTIVRLKSGKLINLRIDVMSNRPNQNSFFMLQGTKGAIETGRGPLGQKEMDKAWFGDGTTKLSRGIKWNDLWDYAHLLPENYRNMPEGAKELAKNGDYNACGGDYYVVQDFIRAIRGEIAVPVDVYDACEWSAVACLAEISAQNNGKAIIMPNFRGVRSDMELKI